MRRSRAAPVIVLAEDDPGIAALVVETLQADLEAEVIVVQNGALVMDAVVHRGAALLILDISMPGASGIDVYDAVRNHRTVGATPILFMTAEPDRGLATLDRNGRRDVIAKPFDLDELVRRVRTLLPAA